MAQLARTGRATVKCLMETKVPPRSVCKSSRLASAWGQIGKRRDLRCHVFRRLFGSQQAAKEQKPMQQPAEIAQDELPFPADMLDGTHLQGRPLACAYKASVHGWSALQFHAKCDMKGPCVVYCITSTGMRFGGFNSVGFSSSDDYAASSKAFLFCWREESAQPLILRKVPSMQVGGTEAALFDYARGGPQWGADALVIGPPQAPVMGGIAGPDSQTLGAGDLHVAKCRLGLAYEKIPAKMKQSSLFGNSKQADVAEVEVYYSPEIAALY